MPSSRRQNPVRRRRRVAVKGEDDVPTTGGADDSQSEASLPSDDDGDADDSDLSETDASESESVEDTSKSNGATKSSTTQHASPSTSTQPQPADASSFPVSDDTNIMMNGLQISDQAIESEALHYNAVEGSEVARTANTEVSQPKPQETLAERKRREHEEYKQKRDQDPAFIPNRGAFFMHDHRSAAPGQNGFRPFGRGGMRGNGRGRNMIGGPYSPAMLSSQPPDAISTPWAHDLHESVQEPHAGHQPTSAPVRIMQQGGPNTTAGAIKNTFPVRNYSTTKDIAYVKLRVSLPGMASPLIHENHKIRQYTKLPDHRPPLRRDKPVRISLPDKTPAYRWPAQERSFTFIPRALRPNQQSYRGRARLGSIGGFSSRKTSMYGGSVYSPSIPMSRRSSLAREFIMDGIAVSPSGSIHPVVNLPGPPRSQYVSANGTPVIMSTHGTPIMNAPPLHGYPLPQKPTYRENWPANMTMHQPRPQKTVSVAGIESPAYNATPAQQQEQLPFQHQLPPQVNGGSQPFFPGVPHQQHYPGQIQQQSSGTPLSNIPERAIHAPAFQPQPFAQQPQYQAAAPTYYYAHPQPQYPPGSVVAPMFIPNGQHGTIIVPTIMPAPGQAYVQQQPVQQMPQAEPSTAGQANLVAHEQNGMVYYYNPQDMYGQGQAAAQPAPEGFAQGGNYTMPGMGGMMTPTPDGYYYPQVPQGTIYYPQQ